MLYHGDSKELCCDSGKSEILRVGLESTTDLPITSSDAPLLHERSDIRGRNAIKLESDEVFFPARTDIVKMI